MKPYMLIRNLFDPLIYGLYDAATGERIGTLSDCGYMEVLAESSWRAWNDRRTGMCEEVSDQPSLFS